MYAENASTQSLLLFSLGIQAVYIRHRRQARENPKRETLASCMQCSCVAEMRMRITFDRCAAAARRVACLLPYKRGCTGTGKFLFLRFWSLPDEDALTKWRPKQTPALYTLLSHSMRV